jgi:hypothetical protein
VDGVADLRRMSFWTIVCPVEVEPGTFADGELARRVMAAPPGEARREEDELFRRFAPRVRFYSLRHLGNEAATPDPLARHHLARCLAALTEKARTVLLMTFFQEDDLESGETERQSIEDVPLDRRHGEVVTIDSGDFVRSLPKSRWTVEARVHGPGGERRVGPYRLDHTPWEQLDEPT